MEVMIYHINLKQNVIVMDSYFTKERNIENPIKLNGKLLKPKHLNLRNIYSELKALMIALN